jgi:hypothetical protein
VGGERGCRWVGLFLGVFLGMLLKIERVVAIHASFIRLMDGASYTNSSPYKLVWRSIG